MDQTTKLLTAWIDSARDYAIILVDPEGRVSSWNVGAERILGYSEAEVWPRFRPWEGEDRAPEAPNSRACG